MRGATRAWNKWVFWPCGVVVIVVIAACGLICLWRKQFLPSVALLPVIGILAFVGVLWWWMDRRLSKFSEITTTVSKGGMSGQQQLRLTMNACFFWSQMAVMALIFVGLWIEGVEHGLTEHAQTAQVGSGKKAETAATAPEEELASGSHTIMLASTEAAQVFARMLEYEVLVGVAVFALGLGWHHIHQQANELAPLLNKTQTALRAAVGGEEYVSAAAEAYSGRGEWVVTVLTAWLATGELKRALECRDEGVPRILTVGRLEPTIPNDVLARVAWRWWVATSGDEDEEPRVAVYCVRSGARNPAATFFAQLPGMFVAQGHTERRIGFANPSLPQAKGIQQAVRPVVYGYVLPDVPNELFAAIRCTLCTHAKGLLDFLGAESSWREDLTDPLAVHGVADPVCVVCAYRRGYQPENALDHELLDSRYPGFGALWQALGQLNSNGCNHCIIADVYRNCDQPAPDNEIAIRAWRNKRALQGVVEAMGCVPQAAEAPSHDE